MSTNLNKEVVPSIESVTLRYKQKFKTGGVSKNTMSFERVEDMMFMCLSIFLHDFVHDYSLGGIGFGRVIKGNVSRTKPDEPSLFETLGIKVANRILRIFKYEITVGDRQVIMYDDSKFKNVSSRQEDPVKKAFYNYLNNNEQLITIGGQRGELLTAPIESDNIYENKVEATNPYIDDKEPVDEEGDTDQKDITTEEELAPKENIESIPIQSQGEVLQPQNQFEELYVQEPSVIAEGISSPVIPFKTINFNDVKDILVIPSAISSLEVEKIVRIFEKNPDFLSFHSSLNTYVVTYLGYDVNENNELNETTEDKNVIADKAIKASLSYIIGDLKNPNNSEEINFYGDTFRLLLDSYEMISRKKSDNKENPFDILNSSEILYQFIIFYVCYLTSESYDSFKQMINPMNGGEITSDDEGEIEMEDQGSQGVAEDSALSPSSDGLVEHLLPDRTYKNELIPEYVFITHNNLLTTIARGMFIKLGIWRRIFFTDAEAKSIQGPTNYIFGPDQLNAITYEKLVELFPTNPKQGGHHNNELLILEILILKRLLVEMSPSKTLTFGSKIDDELKNFMDTFYFDLYNMSTFPQNIDEEKKALSDDVLNNPDFSGDMSEDRVREEEDLFIDCDDNCDDESLDSFQIGGMNYEDRAAVIAAQKELKQLEDEKRKKIQDAIEDLGKLEQRIINNNSNNQVVSTERTPVIQTEEIAPVIQTEEVNLDEVIVEPPNPPNIPILFNKLKKMYQNNILVMRELQNSKIIPITITVDHEEKKITNLFELLELNEILIHREGSSVNIPAPKYKFVIDNSVKMTSNLNGSRMFIPKRFLDTVTTTISEIKKNVYDGEVINDEKLAVYISQINNDLNNQNEELNKIKEKIKEINKKESITIREYNELLKLKYDQKTFERTVIQPILNELFLLKTIKENPSFYEDFLKNYSEWFRDMQPIFGLYRNLQRGVFCPTSSMMDAMDQCSLKHNSTEPKEVGTSFSEIIYDGENGKVSFGGVVLNYNELVGEKEKLISKIYYTLESNLSGFSDPDVMIMNTLPIQVSESEDLKARTAYKSVVRMIKSIYDEVQLNETETASLGAQSSPPEGKEYIKKMWANVQYQFSRERFNKLLSATSLKTMGDYLQECQAVFKWGGYINNQDAFPIGLKSQEQFDLVKDKLIYRSVSSEEAIIPYDENTGDGLRLGIQGDRPSGSRSIYMLLNGEGDVNDQAMTGYMNTNSTQNPSRTLLVARNFNINRDQDGNIIRVPNKNGLKGSVLYVTRELRIPERDSLLRSLEFLNVKDKNIRVSGEDVIPDITEITISGSQDVTGELYERPRGTKPPEYKNDYYNDWLDYNQGQMIELKSKNKKKEESDVVSPAKGKRESAKVRMEKYKSAEKIIQNIAPKNIEDDSYLITTGWLDTLRERLTELGIEEDIFEEYYNNIADKEIQLKNVEEKKAKSAEKKELKAKETALKAQVKRIEKIKTKLRNEFLESEEGQILNNRITDLDNKILELLDSKEKLKPGRRKVQTAEVQAKIDIINGEIEQKQQEIEAIDSQINEKVNELFEAQKGSISGGSYTRSNKKQHNYRRTKREYKWTNKLTKRNKKSRFPRKTRKNVYNRIIK